MQSSPKAGVFNKLKKKLTKGRRYELGACVDDCDGASVKCQKIEGMYGKIPNDDTQKSSRDSSPNVKESPKRTVLDSPQRANLSEKDTNKTNTYTKDPTKEQKKTGSPTKDIKTNKESGGPIIFINNTYDLPPVVPIKKGAISEKRQRSKERSKDHGSNKDSKKCEVDKQAVGNGHSDENKENSKVVPAACKSPFKSKKEKVNTAVGKTDVTLKQGLCNNGLGDSESCVVRGDDGSSAKNMRSSNHSVNVSQNELALSGGSLTQLPVSKKSSHVETENVKDSVEISAVKQNANEVRNGLLKINPSAKSKTAVSFSTFKSDKINSTTNSEKQSMSTGMEVVKPTIKRAEIACNSFKNLNEKAKLNTSSVHPETDDSLLSDDEYESYVITYKSGPNDLNLVDSSNKPNEANESKSIATTRSKDQKPVDDILSRSTAGLPEHNKCPLVGNKKQFTSEAKKDTSKDCHNDKSAKQREATKNSKNKSEYISIEDYGAVVNKSVVKKPQNVEMEVKEEDYDLGYTSLADMEKIFGGKDKTKSGNVVTTTTKREDATCHSDSNGNVMNDPGRVIKCDVTVQGGNVRPLLGMRLPGTSFINGNNKKVKPESAPAKPAKKVAPPPPPRTSSRKKQDDDNDYESMGDYSSSCNKNKNTTDQKWKNQQLGARPKQITVKTSDDYVACDSPIVTKVTVVRDMSMKDDSDHDAYTDLATEKITNNRNSTSSNLDVNLNIEVERGISHESGYETGGSGLRSHSSSSNEFMQHDLSNYSLTSEQGDDVIVNDAVHMDLNDSTSSEESTGSMRNNRKKYGETPEHVRVAANVYAFIPKGTAQNYKGLDSHMTSDGDSELSGSTDKTETFGPQSQDHSPDSLTVDTLIDDIDDDGNDSDAYTDEVDYGFEDCDEEDDDYLPPIPTRNYTSEEKKATDDDNAASNMSEMENKTNAVAPPLMRVIMNNKDKVTTLKKSNSIKNGDNNVNGVVVEKKIVAEDKPLADKIINAEVKKERIFTEKIQSSDIESSQKKEVEKPKEIALKVTSPIGKAKVFPEKVKSPIGKAKLLTEKGKPGDKPKGFSEKVKSPVRSKVLTERVKSPDKSKVLSEKVKSGDKPKVGVSEKVKSPTKNINKSHEVVKPKFAKIPDINEGLLAKAKSRAVSAMMKTKYSASGTTSEKNKSKQSLCSPTKETNDKVSSKSKESNETINNKSTSRRFKFSPVRKKSYEKVERSTPIKEIDPQPQKRTSSPFSSITMKIKGRESHDSSKETFSSSEKEGYTSLEKETLISNKSKKKSVVETVNLTVDNVAKSEKVLDTPNKLANKNDELCNQSFSSDSTLSLDQQFWASFEEPVHMSVEEVMTQAKDLGIPLSLSMHGSRHSSGSVSSNESGVCSPTHRISSQTLPCPKHGIITQDKLPRKKPGTLKDKFASLFAKKSSGSTNTSPKNNKGLDNIQHRSLPPAPPGPGKDFDMVDGTIMSPSRRYHHPGGKDAKTICKIHGNVSSHIQTFSPSRHGRGTLVHCPEDCSLCTTTSSSRKCNTTPHRGSSNNKKHVSGYHHHGRTCCCCNCNSQGYCVQDNCCCSNSHSAGTFHQSYSHDHGSHRHSNNKSVDVICNGSNTSHHRSRSKDIETHHRPRHHSTSAVSHHEQKRNQRDRSHSRDPEFSRSGSSPHHVGSWPTKVSPVHHGFSSSTSEPRTTRSSSSSGM